MTRPGDRPDASSDSTDSSDAEGSGSDGVDRSAVDPADAFAALSDPTRVDILRELTVHRRETGEAVAGFADLRRRVGVRDSGRFRYHLNELRDQFVAKAEGGYRLTTAGRQVVAGVLAGTYTERVSMGPVELDSECSTCGAPAVARYEDRACAVACENGHRLFQWNVPPNATEGATLPAVVDLAELLAVQAVERAVAGVCPTCCDPLEPAVAVGGDGAQPRFRAVCDACGGRVVGPVTFCLLVDPRVAAFFRRHDRRLRDEHLWELPFVADESAVTVADDDPVRVDVAVALDGETLAVTVDETGGVDVASGPDGG
ncbi:MAG: winged helix-turn-helix domain-containing protein [Haloarculaceae archaeon]